VHNFVKNKWNCEDTEEIQKFEDCYEHDFMKKSNFMIIKSADFTKICNQKILYKIYQFLGENAENLFLLSRICKNSIILLENETIYMNLCKKYYPSYSQIMPFTYKYFWQQLCENTNKITRNDYFIPLPNMILNNYDKNNKPQKIQIFHNECTGTNLLYGVQISKLFEIYSSKCKCVYSYKNAYDFKYNSKNAVIIKDFLNNLHYLNLSDFSLSKICEIAPNQDWAFDNYNLYFWDSQNHNLISAKITENSPIQILNSGLKYESCYGLELPEKPLIVKSIENKGLIVTNCKTESNVYMLSEKTGKITAIFNFISNFDCDNELFIGHNTASEKIEIYDLRKIDEYFLQN